MRLQVFNVKVIKTLEGFTGKCLELPGAISEGNTWGSHLILSNGEKFISMPRHSPIAMGTLREILLEAKVSEADFVKKL